MTDRHILAAQARDLFAKLSECPDDTMAIALVEEAMQLHPWHGDISAAVRATSGPVRRQLGELILKHHDTIGESPKGGMLVTVYLRVPELARQAAELLLQRDPTELHLIHLLMNEGPMKTEVGRRLVEIHESQYTLSLSIEHCPALREDHGRRFLDHWNSALREFFFDEPCSEYESVSSRSARSHEERVRSRRVAKMLRDLVPALSQEAGEYYERMRK